MDVVHVDSIEIAAPPEQVFEHRLDFTQLRLINPNVSNLSRADGGSEPGEGAVYKFDTSIEGMGTMPTTLTVTQAQRPTLVSNVMDAGIPAREITTFEPTEVGTLVTFTVTIELPEGAEELEPMVRESTAANVRMELENMKSLFEGA